MLISKCYLQERIDYGVMNSCLVKPALYLVQVNMIINMIIIIMIIIMIIIVIINFKILL